ncbi:hypothetical protein GCG54_00000078 [Colletotrichum gloeosporioides]|uniref:Anaphase-promoting complex, subunit CDC26 n=1 Tax=Colletotrichum gloeosporioides TaxID=474922 RepID=A0A8H4CN51_COLGL|nr:uncharacterized protein GCG54_00000078 [Colletotrichum gloeosporioides]KAF3806712.1 hypothetical protein GCG54_00000078 [Colletotrichum gloeosporioides]
MLRRPATTLSITAEDIAAYEDRRAREAMLRERQALIQAQQQQQQQRILQQQQQQLPSSSPQRQQQPYDPDISAEEYAEYEAHQAELLRRQDEMMRAQQQQAPVQRLGQSGRGAAVMQTTPTPGDGGRGGRTREDRIGVGRRGR